MGTATGWWHHQDRGTRSSSSQFSGALVEHKLCSVHPRERSGCPRPPRCLWDPLSPRTVPAGGSPDFQLVAAATAAPGAAGSGPEGCQDAPDGRQQDAGAGRPGRQRGAPGGAAVPNWGSSPLNPIRYCKKKDERAGESLQTLLIKSCTIFCIPKSRQPPALPQDTPGCVSGTAWTGTAAHRAPAAGGTGGRGCGHGFSRSGWRLGASLCFSRVFSFAGEKV